MGEALDPDKIDALWGKFATDVDRMMERVNDSTDFAVSPGSSLAGDDRASDPYQVSHAVQMCIVAGVDHLHAMKSLLFDLNVLHSAAPFTLVRGALEIFASAFWILHPTGRSTRIERVLRWYAKNFHDQHPALQSLSLSDVAQRDAKYARLAQIGSGRGIPENRISAGYQSTEAVQYADMHARTAKPLLSWRMCSGYAHGRPWVYLGMADEDMFEETGDPDVLMTRVTSDPGKLLYPSLHAQWLMRDVVDLVERRATDPLRRSQQAADDRSRALRLFAP
ncbi:hypothetical protein H7J88_03230 [Mycolicibacterium flavescens]|uniref:Uncharacterized protein n=1 Tax=Mycolicibacterium flavescens TaxID=1776 RepID=A0A1E3RBL3_MYCFV|nr:hypothetical protein [Mycolicibacterium flavescens]MCV7278661.1 hypothetical protein [Mycolicibacterium flavescens]ODQ87293.1 hypothetical protein BHQ18_24285 [Mycolicibacterium flavescens]